MTDDDPTRNFSSHVDGGDESVTLHEMFKLIRSMNGDIKALQSDFQQYKIRTTPLAETLDALRVEVKSIAERQDQFGNEMTGMRGEMTEMRGEITEMRGKITEMRGKINELERVIRRVETKLDGFATISPDMQGTLHYHSVRLLELESK